MGIPTLYIGGQMLNFYRIKFFSTVAEDDFIIATGLFIGFIGLRTGGLWSPGKKTKLYTFCQKV